MNWDGKLEYKGTILFSNEIAVGNVGWYLMDCLTKVYEVKSK